MKTRNCPNCAAPYDVDLSKCPYCGTSYFDMSGLDIDAGEPFYLKINDNGTVLTQLVRLTNASITQENDSISAYGGVSNSKLIRFTTEVSIKTKLEFEAVPQEKNVMMTLRKGG